MKVCLFQFLTTKETFVDWIGGNVKTNAEDIKENRDLVSWEAEHGADAELGELENEKGGDWDQFAVSNYLFFLNRIII